MLAQALFAYVRAGRLDDAVELCRKMHQPWRAASLRGAQLFQWKAICASLPPSLPLPHPTPTPSLFLVQLTGSTATEPHDDDDADDAAQDGEQEDAAFDAWHGNRRRRLWKAACTRAALDVRPSIARHDERDADRLPALSS